MAVVTLALLLDLIVGDPKWLWKRFPHPVVWFGKLIDLFDRNRRNWKLENLGEEVGVWPGFIAGLLMLLALLILSVIIWEVVSIVSNISAAAGFVLETLLVAVLIAQKSLYDHVKNVAFALRQNGLEGGRKAVSLVVGRDVSRLNESGVCKAAIESLAEEGRISGTGYAFGLIPVDKSSHLLRMPP